MAKTVSRTTRTKEDPTTAAAAAGAVPTPGIAAAVYFGLSLIFFLPAFLPGQHIYGTDYLGGG
jgi:hypothetical protein